MTQSQYLRATGDIAYRLWAFDVLFKMLKETPDAREKQERLLRQIQGYAKNTKFLLHRTMDDVDFLKNLELRLVRSLKGVK